MIPIVICSSNIYSSVVSVSIESILRVFSDEKIFEFHVIGLTKYINIDERAEYYIYPGSDMDSWSTRVKFGIGKLPFDNFILITEDILFTRGCVKYLVDVFEDFITSNKKYLRLSPFPGPDIWHEEIGFVSSKCLHRISMQPSIWYKDYLINLLSDGETIWEFELYGSFRTGYYDQIYALGNRKIEYIEIITRGELTPVGFNYIRKLGYVPIALPVQSWIVFIKRLLLHKVQHNLMRVRSLRFFSGW